MCADPDWYRDPNVLLGRLQRSSRGAPVIGGYDEVREIHRGGQGVVYAALQKSTGRKVALKVMREGPFASAQDRARFDREIHILAQLRNPNIVTIHDSGVAVGHFFFVMDYVEGARLGEYAEKLRGPPAGGARTADLLRLFAKICEAVNAAHLRGVIHRDLKPANILVDADGEPRILDFGLAKATGDESQSPEITRSGYFFGSLPWASPEQAQGAPEKIDVRTDVYSLGVILYNMLTGRFPYTVTGNFREVLNEIIQAEPVRPSSVRKQIGEELETIILKALAKERARRYQSAGALAVDIRRFLAGEPIEAKRDSTWYVLRKQLRRHRAPVAAIAAIVVLLALSSAFLGMLSLRLGRQAEALRNSDYIHRIALAHAAHDDANIGQMRELIAQCPSELKGWEWYRLNWLSDLSLQTLHGHTQEVSCVALSPNGTRIVSGGEDNLVKVWDSDSGVELQSFDGHEGPVRSVAFTSNGQHVMSCSFDKTIRLWDLAAGLEVERYGDGVTAVQSAALRPDDLVIAAGHEDNAVRLWDVRGRRLLQPPLRGHRELVQPVVFAPDSQTIVSGSEDDTLLVWEATTGKIMMTLKGHTGEVRCIAVCSERREIASGGRDKTIRLWDAVTGRCRERLVGHAREVTSVAYSPDGRWIASGSRDGTVRLWDPQSPENTLILRGHTSDVISVSFSPDGKRIISGSSDHTIKIWDANTVGWGRDEAGNPVRMLRGHQQHVVSAAFNSDGSRLVSGSWDGTVKIWDMSTGAELLTLSGHDGYVWSVAYSPDDLRIVSGGSDATVRVWNAARGGTELVLHGHSDEVHSVAWGPNGRRVLSGSWDGTLRLWDISGDDDPLTWGTHDDRVWSVGFSRDGTRAVSAGRDRAVRVWDTVSGKEVLTIRHETKWTTCAIFSADGRRVIANDDKVVKVWDARTGRQIHELVQVDDRETIECLALSRDGRRIVGGGGRTISLWDAGTGVEVLTLRGGDDRVWSVQFSPDGTRLVSCGAQNAIKVWESSGQKP